MEKTINFQRLIYYYVIVISLITLGWTFNFEIYISLAISIISSSFIIFSYEIFIRITGSFMSERHIAIKIPPYTLILSSLIPIIFAAYRYIHTGDWNTIITPITAALILIQIYCMTPCK